MGMGPIAFFICFLHPSWRSNGTISKISYGQSYHPSRNRQSAHSSCWQKRRNVKYLENLKYILSETQMKLYAIVKKPDVERSLMCSNRNVWGNYYQTETCWILTFSSAAQWGSITLAICSGCQLSPSSAHHRHTKPVWPNVTSEVTGLPQQFMNLSTISISSHRLT